VSHMVIYRTNDGKPGFQQTDDLVSAVEFVERLRNLEGVESARIYRLEQVNFRFQPYYQVHIETAEAPNAPRPLVSSENPAGNGAPMAAAAQMATPATPVAMAEPAPAPVPPRVLSAAMAAAAAEPAQAGPTFDLSDAGAASASADDQPEGAGIRRGLFGR